MISPTSAVDLVLRRGRTELWPRERQRSRADARRERYRCPCRRSGCPHYDAPSDACLPSGLPAAGPDRRVQRPHWSPTTFPACPADRRARGGRLHRPAHRRCCPRPCGSASASSRSASGLLGRLVGLDRLAAFLARRPVPVLGEYVRLVRSLAYAYVWDTWPAPPRRPARRGAPVTAAPEGPDRARPRCRPTSVVSARAPAAHRRPRCWPRPASTCSCSRRGRWSRQGDVVPFSLEQMDRQYRAGGVTAALGLPSIAYTEGCCAGGGTEVNSGLYRRPPEEVLERWRTRAGAGGLRIATSCTASATRSSGSCRSRPCPERRPRPAKRYGAAPPRSAGTTTRSRDGCRTPTAPTPVPAAGRA